MMDATEITTTLDLAVVPPRVIVAAGFPLAIEFLPDDDCAVVSSASFADDYWSKASIVSRLRSHFDGLLASAASR